MQAVIIAGGKGTRLSSIAKDIPKTMMQLKNKPVLQYQIELLKKYKITDIVIIVSRGSQKIEEYFKQGGRFGVKISYFNEPYPLGSAGAFRLIKDRLPDDFMVLYGDLMVNIDLNRLIKFHNKTKGIASLVIHPNNHPFDSDLVEIDNTNRVTKLHSKPHPKNLLYSNLVNAGIYILNKRIITYIPPRIASDFGKDIFPHILKLDTDKICGYKTHEYVKDMGTVDRYHEVIKDINNGIYQTGNRKIKRPAIFLDRDGVINAEVDNITKLKDFTLLPFTASAIKKINQSGYLVIVISNQPQMAKGLCTMSTLEKLNKKMEVLLGNEGVKLDGIYFCPHHPEKGFPGENIQYKRRCSCRKPNINMIRQAIKEFNIDIKKSYFIGDQTMDAKTAKNAGIRFLGVQTGYGCKDNKYEVTINKLFIDLNNAVDYLLNT